MCALCRPTGHVFRLERTQGPVWYAKYRPPHARQVQKEMPGAKGLTGLSNRSKNKLLIQGKEAPGQRGEPIGAGKRLGSAVEVRHPAGGEPHCTDRDDIRGHQSAQGRTDSEPDLAS